MLCDMCNINEASIFLHVRNTKTECPNCKKPVTFGTEQSVLCKNCSTVVYPKDQRVMLCVDCAREYGMPTGNEIIDNVAKEPEFDKMMEAFFEIKNKNACNVCGKTLVDIRKSKTFGCPNCFSLYNTEIAKMLGEGQKYRGSFPKENHDDNSTIMQQRFLLNKELQDCVQAEDYENAAIVRDKLKELDNLL